ncbi:mucin-2 isoform X7 [Tribolium castaneum]|uniref:mucin-2 isoform X7 n=1 Tax=Tribolium castaneum TaxID=7070 RepID=UPI0030FE4C20
MKFCYLLFFICLLSVDAQRRSVKSELLSENEPQPKTARRGRARFTLTSESPQVDEPKRSETSSRRLSSRRRPSETHVATPVKIAKSYEVEEIVDEAPLEALRRPKSKLFAETPIESFRKPSNSKLYTEAKFEETPVESVRRPSSKLYNEPKFEETPVESVRRPSAKLYTEAKFHETSERRPVKSRVLTETKFEAQNAPSSNALFQPSTTENLDEIIKSIGDVLDTTSSSVPLSSTLSSSSLESLSSELTSEVTKIDNDISRTQPETTTPITSRTTRRSNGRSRSNVAASPTVASRVRSRTRATRRPEEPSPAPTAGRTVHRGARRRNEPPSVESRTRGPPVIQAAETMEAPTRSRNGRRTPGTAARKNEEVTVPEKVTLDLPQSRRLGSRKSVETTTFRSRSRTRSRDIPPIIDEQKLEVLPLFERESKTVRPLRSGNSRRRNINSAEEVETSATENDIKVGPKPPKETVVVETRTESTIKRRKIISKVSRRSTTTSKPTVQTSKTTVQTPKSTIVTRKPVVKESVISEVSEVTSKRTVSRQNKAARTKTESPKFVQRGTKKSEINLTNVKSKSSVTSSEEEIDDSDNYPEQFKALLQAKKQKKESRSQHRLVTAAPAVTKTTEKVVNSSPSSTTQVIASEASRQQLEESENELVPRKVQPGRRFTQTTEKATRPTRKSKVARSTTVAPSTSTKEHRFHAKFNTEPEATTSSPVKSGRSLSPKPPRGLYSSRKTKESYTKNKSPSGQIPTPKKSNRYSSRYRNDAAARGAIRTSTNAPAYLPTIPTITPPTTSVKSSYRDKDLGVEVISFDDPVNTVPSANLVSGEYLASSTESHLTSPLVNWQNNKIKTETEKTLFLKVAASQTKTTEKPFSIIESIINSITAISTTEKPDPTKLTFSTDDPTQASAILKLATKKPTKLDKTQTTQLIPVVTVTSEKPTTIIERILSSLSAIQADNNTDTKNFKSKQVGSNFNTISSPSTTPITRVTKSTLSAQYSTTVNPLTVLDEISNEQILQKRTIGKLLALLNTLTSTTPRSHPTQLVVVTPKATNYVVGTRVIPTSATATSTTIEPILSSTVTTTTTTEPTTTSTTTAPTTTTTTTSNQLFTSPSPSGASISSRVKPPESTTMRYTTTPTYTTLSTLMPPTTTMSSITTPSRTEAVPTTMTPKDISNEIGALPLSFETGGSTTPSTTTDSSLSVGTTEPFDTDTDFVFPSTIPALVNFEVEQNTIPPVEANPLSISTVNIPPTTGTTPSSTVPTAQANPLSVSSSSSTSTTESSTSTSTSTSSPPPVSTTSATTTSSTTSAATLPTLTEILTGRTGKAFNSIINISDLTKVETLKVDPKTNRVLNADEFKNKTGVIYRWKPVTSSTYMFQTDLTSTTLPSPTLSNRILDNPTTMPPMTSMRFTTMPPMTSMRFTTMPPMTLPASIRLTTTPTTTMAPTTTPFFTTTTMPPTTTPMQTRRQTTIPPFTQPVTSSFQTTTGFPTSTYFPQFLTTLFSTIRPRRVSATESPITIVTPISNRIQPVTSPRVDISTNVFDLTTAGSTRRPTTVDLTTGTTRRIATTTVPTTVPFTVPISTTVRSRRRSTTTTTTLPTTTTILTTTTPPTTRATSQRSARRSTTTEATTTTTNATKKLRQLTEQQKKDLEAIAQLEQEQAAILRQLAFLTNLNIGGNMRTTTDRTDLAKRIVALAVERDKDRPKPITTTPLPEVSTPESKREAKKISVSSDQSLEEIVKQFNIVTPSPITTEYGKSNDAIIAALLKEQGIGPTTPKVLEDVYSHTTTTTKRPKTTTRPPGPLMQSLNWLLNVLAPQPTTTTTTKRPKPKTKTKSKPKPKPKPEPKPDEILTHQPTHITPVVTAAPRRNLVSSLSQQDIQKLIRQLENIQKDPTNSQELDFSQIKSLQALLNSDEGVQVTSSGSTGATSRPNTTPLTTAKRRNKGRVAKSTTAEPLSVSNSIADDEEFVSTTTTRSRVSLPPVRLRPVPGIEDGDTLVRGQLITAAVNVTRAISSFLGTALQDAAQQVSRLFANGSANFKDYLGSSSVLANASNFSAASRV